MFGCTNERLRRNESKEAWRMGKQVQKALAMVANLIVLWVRISSG